MRLSAESLVRQLPLSNLLIIYDYDNKESRKTNQDKIPYSQECEWYRRASSFERFPQYKQIYAQVINDITGTTLASASSLGLEKMNKTEQAKKVGELVANKAKEAGVEKIVFDRNGYLYHGRVQALADAAREGGLKF